MNQIKDEIMQLKSKLKKIEIQQKLELNNFERIQYLIPTWKKWNPIDKTDRSDMFNSCRRLPDKKCF